jgi:hypothetical protein
MAKKTETLKISYEKSEDSNSKPANSKKSTRKTIKPDFAGFECSKPPRNEYK